MRKFRTKEIIYQHCRLTGQAAETCSDEGNFLKAWHSVTGRIRPSARISCSQLTVFLVCHIFVQCFYSLPGVTTTRCSSASPGYNIREGNHNKQYFPGSFSTCGFRNSSFTLNFYWTAPGVSWGQLLFVPPPQPLWRASTHTELEI